jgi:hypothetical protein
MKSAEGGSVQTDPLMDAAFRNEGFILFIVEDEVQEKINARLSFC